MLIFCLLFLNPVKVTTGAELYYEKSGSGPALFLIGGWGADHTLFDSLRRELEKDFTVIAADNRGVGGSTDPGGVYSVAAMAEDIASLAETLGYDRYHVLGISLGGFVAQELAYQHPDRVDRLILVATSMGGAVHVAPGPEVMQYFMASGGMPPEQRIREGLLLALHPEYAANHGEQITARVKKGVEEPVDQAVLGKQTMAAMTFSFADRAASMNTPTLVLHGADDRIVVPANGKRLAETLPNATFLEIPASGHLTIIDQTKACARAVRDFLLTGS